MYFCAFELTFLFSCSERQVTTWTLKQCMYLLCIEPMFVLWAQKKFGPSLCSMHRTLKYRVLVWRTLLESRLPINREKFLPPKKVLFPFLPEKDLNWYNFLACTLYVYPKEVRIKWSNKWDRRISKNREPLNFLLGIWT